MSPWKSARIASFCTTGTGGTPSRSCMDRYYNGGTIPWVKSGELRETVIKDTEEHVTEMALRETNVKMVPAGALLLAIYGATVGRLGILGVPATTNQAVCHIIPDPKVADVRYLFHALSNQVSHLVARGVGGAQPNISQGIVKDLALPLPPLVDQRRIAEVLDRAEALRTKRLAALAKLVTLIQSIFIDFSAQVECGGFPNMALGDAVELVTVGHVGPTAEFFCDDGIPFLRTGNVGAFDIIRSDLRYITPEFHSKLKKSTLKEGDVLVSRVISDEVRCAVVPPEFDGANCANVIIIRPGSRMSSQYLAYLIRSPRSQRAFLQRQVGSAQSVVNTGVLQGWQVTLPPLPLQQGFAHHISAVERLKTAYRASLAELDALFASLQYRAFRGEF